MVHTFEAEKEEGAFSIKELAVTGNDVMAIMKISSGKRVGEVLNHLLERVLDEGRDLNNRDTLLAMIHELV